MKKAISVLLAAFMLAGLFACDKTAAPEKSIVAAETAEASSTPPASAAADLSGYDFTQYGFERSALALPEDVENANGLILCDGRISFSYTADGEQGDAAVRTACAMNPDGSGYTATALPPLPEDTYYSNLTVGADAVWCIVEAYQEVPGKKDELTTESTLQKLDLNGSILAEYPLNPFFENEDFLFVSQLLPDPDGGLWVTANATLLRFDGSLNLLWSLSDFSDFLSDSIALTAEGTLVCLDEGKLFLADKDGATPVSITLEENAQNWILCSGSGGYDLFIYDAAALYAADIGTGTLTQLLAWSDWGVDGEQAQLIGALSETAFLVDAFDLLTKESAPIILTRVPRSQIPEKTTITIASGPNGLEEMVSAAISAFNAESTAYSVQAVTYAEETDLDLAILSGDCPDLLVFDYMPKDKYISKGLLADMLDLMTQYGGFSREDFVQSYLNAAMTGGKLYTTSLYFYFRTFVGLPQYVGTKQGWSTEDFVAAAKAMPEGMQASAFTGSDFLTFCLDARLSEFVDVETGVCSFDSPAFIELLTLCQGYMPEAYPEETEDYTDFSRVLGGSLLMELYMPMGFSDYIMDSAQIDQLTIMGYPGLGGNGAAFNTQTYYGVYSGSPNMEGAWSFMAFLLSERFQNALYSSVFPVNAKVLKDKAERIAGLRAEEYPDAQARAEELLAYIDGIGSDVRREQDIYDIVSEEAAYFFAGEKTAEETAAIIQNRVETYIAERG